MAAAGLAARVVFVTSGGMPVWSTRRRPGLTRKGGCPPSRAAGHALSAAGVSDYREAMCAANPSLDGQLPSLYAQAQATRQQSLLLAAQLRASRRKAQENWQLIQAAWDRAHQIRAVRLAATTDEERLRYSAYARTRAKLASLPVIEQAKGIIMAQCGWSEDQAFDALRRASQRENIKVRDLAAQIVARAASSAPAQPRAGRAPASARSAGGRSGGRSSSPAPAAGSDGFRDRRRASA
jgi:hypothetical protein